jgi:hypothetical protein
MRGKRWFRASFIAALGAALHLGASVNAGAQEKPAREPRGLLQGPGVVVSAEVRPNPALVGVGSSFWLTLSLKDAQGNAVSAPSVQWSSSDPAIVTVAPVLTPLSDARTGRSLARSTPLIATLTGVRSGEALVTASAGGRTASAKVAVVPTTEEYSCDSSSATCTCVGVVDCQNMLESGDCLDSVCGDFGCVCTWKGHKADLGFPPQR